MKDILPCDVSKLVMSNHIEVIIKSMRLHRYDLKLQTPTAFWILKHIFFSVLSFDLCYDTEYASAISVLHHTGLENGVLTQMFIGLTMQFISTCQAKNFGCMVQQKL